MTQSGVEELYTWLSTAWMTQVKPGAPEQWVRAKKRELYTTYKDYRDEEVIAAFQKWTEENEKFPSMKNILNEIKWSRTIKVGRKENEILWPMDIIYPDGNEYSYGSFTRSEFVNHPRNTEHLQPEEWERRFRKTRNRILKALIEARGGHVNYEAGKEWVDWIRGKHEAI